MSHRTQSPVQRLDPLRNIWLDIAARAHAVCSTSERRILSERHCTSVASCQGVNVLKCALEDARHRSSIHIHVEEEACDLIAEYYMYRDHLLNVVVLHIAIVGRRPPSTGITPTLICLQRFRDSVVGPPPPAPGFSVP